MMREMEGLRFVDQRTRRQGIRFLRKNQEFYFAIKFEINIRYFKEDFEWSVRYS